MTRRAYILAVCIFAVPAVAHADAKEACGAAFTAGPELVKKGSLLEARASLTKCATAPCPDSMRSLCADDLKKLEDRIPTIVFAAKTATGEDLLDAAVTEDGKVVAEKLDGRSIPFDPGPHRYRFERAGSEPVESSVVLREGEHARVVSVVIGPKPLAPAKHEAVAPAPAPRPVESPARPIPWTVYAAGGVTIVAAGAFGVLGAIGLGKRSDLDGCKGRCTSDAVDDGKQKFLFADVALGVAIVGAAVTTILYLTRPSVAPGTTALAR